MPPFQREEESGGETAHQRFREPLLSEREQDLMDLALHTVHTAHGDIVQDVMRSSLANIQESIERFDSTDFGLYAENISDLRKENRTLSQC